MTLDQSAAGGIASPIAQKWDRVYAQKQVDDSPYPTILDEAQHLLPTYGRALDLACGMGGASVFLARHGLHVSAWDLSAVAIEKLNRFAQHEGLPIRAEVVDIAHAAIPPKTFDVIVVSRFLKRSLCASLARALRPGGLLVYQTFSVEATSGASHMNPAYMLMRGELLNLFHDLQPIVYREEALVGDLSRGVRNEAQLIAQRRLTVPSFYLDWVRRMIEIDESAVASDAPAALSRSIEKHRDQLVSLESNIGSETPVTPHMLSNYARIETTRATVVIDCRGETRRALVFPPGDFVMPTDLPGAALIELGQIVERVIAVLRATLGAGDYPCFLPLPSECRLRRLHVIVALGPNVENLQSQPTSLQEIEARVRDTLLDPLAGV
ncbi:SAM-dependent methyltransferase [Pandoraea iniqua]|uniref:SAM-dependent methyltransferase n=1 Tax=Pandoraea iniqua TaxID=2508288 RepID=A0A5E4YFL9_9BURK|nr:methyltransferase domain-containing protein [Pandoraea iniqua]VVE47252.1 SAM-dependent methyltransferase [Pandoraea iniqua]